MVNWNQVAEHASVYWQEFLSWFLSIPMYGQLFVIIGAVAAVVLAVVIVYYVLKGVAYLIYYILKGVYLLLKAIFLGIYKIFESLYYDLTGKPRPVKEEKEEQTSQEVLEKPQEQPVVIETPPKIVEPVAPNIEYCSECGNQFTDQMHTKLSENGMVYCIFCGKGYKANTIKIEQ